MITKIKVGNLLIDNTVTSGYFVKELLTMGAGTKYSVAELLSRHGAKLGNAVYKNKSIAITVLIVGDDADDMLDKRNVLLKELQLNNYSDDDKIKVIFYMANGGVISTYGIVKDINVDINNETVGASQINFMIETEKPFFLSETIYQKTVIVTKGGGCAVPMTIPLDMSKGSTGYTNLIGGGNAFTYPVFRFVGQLTNPVLTHISSAKTMSLTATTIGAGTYIEFDTYNRTVLDNTGANKLDKMAGDFLVIQPDNNNFSLATDNAGDTGYILVTYQDAYATI